MRHLLLCALAVLTAGTVWAAGPSQGTADWVQANAGRVEGKRVWMKVATVNPIRIDGDVHVFHVSTYDGGAFSWIVAHVSRDQAPNFLRRYRSELRFGPNIEVRTRSLGATARLDRDSGRMYLDCTDWRA